MLAEKTQEAANKEKEVISLKWSLICVVWLLSSLLMEHNKWLLLPYTVLIFTAATIVWIKAQENVAICDECVIIFIFVSSFCLVINLFLPLLLLEIILMGEIRKIICIEVNLQQIL